MSDLLTKCTVCGGLIDDEDLFCANCGTEAPHTQDEREADAASVATHAFTCQGCGASMSYDASARTLRCPFCGSEKLEKQPAGKQLAPRRVVPFAISRGKAEDAMREWLGQGFWRPGDLAASAAIDEMTPVYVPYWVFQAKVHTYWTADSSRTPPGARADWYPMSGEHYGEYKGVLVGASGALTPGETNSICPFYLDRAVEPDQVDLENATVEQFRVQRKYARPLAREGLEKLEAAAISAEQVPGKERNVSVNLRVEDMSSEPVLLPVWIMTYRYNEKLYRFLINGQTGAATGEAPKSWRKIGSAVGAAAVGGFLLLMLIARGCG
ncbi:MAG: hypothetical protein MI757_08875 [Pirellulales bacterium]|nr:hypothetical protein [Pirellulales bacterium]